MTYKKLRILQSALELFSKEGYTATSTSKVAKQAGVSEGLLFKHFGNKAGLLDAILKEGEKRIQTFYSQVVDEPDPQKTLLKFIEIPFSIKVSEYDFWKLQFKLKWELNNTSPIQLDPIRETLEQAFSELGYKQPAQEAELLIHTLEGITGTLLKNDLPNKAQFKAFLLNKYGLQEN